MRTNSGGFRTTKRVMVIDPDDGHVIGHGHYNYSTIDAFYSVTLDGELSDHLWPDTCVEFTEEEEGN